MEQRIAKLYESHGQRLSAFLVGMVGDRDAAEDLVQETFARALAADARFEPLARQSTWLFTIARNLAVNHLARKRVTAGHPLAEAASGEPDPAVAAEMREAGGAIRAAVERLSVDHREVFLLKAIEGLTYREIAETIGVPIGTAQSRFHYAAAAIRERLSSEGAGI